MEYPYSDSMMRWDETENRYIITEEALIQNGVDIRSTLAASRSSSPEFVVNGFLKTVSGMIYGFIHRYNSRTDIQDYQIAKAPSLRPVVFRAMLAQAVFLKSMGNKYLSVDFRERASAIDEQAKQELMTYIPEIGHCVLYTGML